MPVDFRSSHELQSKVPVLSLVSTCLYSRDCTFTPHGPWTLPITWLYSPQLTYTAISGCCILPWYLIHSQVDWSQLPDLSYLLRATPHMTRGSTGIRTPGRVAELHATRNPESGTLTTRPSHLSDLTKGIKLTAAVMSTRVSCPIVLGSCHLIDYHHYPPCVSKVGMKWLIYSQTSMVQPLKFGYG